jgi:DNA anti-recombination protein RmuC
MRNYARTNLDQTSRCYFGGGGGGSRPDSGEMRRQNDLMTRQMEQNARQSREQAAAMSAQAKEQQAQMQKQLEIMERSRQDALAGQNAQLEQLKASQVKPEPMARVDEATDDMTQQRKVAARRGGLRKSILAGESYNDGAPLLTGPSTLG